MFAGNGFAQDRKEPAVLGVADDGYLRLVIYVVKTLKCFLCLFVATAFLWNVLVFSTPFCSVKGMRDTPQTISQLGRKGRSHGSLIDSARFLILVGPWLTKVCVTSRLTSGERLKGRLVG